MSYWNYGVAKRVRASTDVCLDADRYLLFARRNVNIVFVVFGFAVVELRTNRYRSPRTVLVPPYVRASDWASLNNARTSDRRNRYVPVVLLPISFRVIHVVRVRPKTGRIVSVDKIKIPYYYNNNGFCRRCSDNGYRRTVVYDNVLSPKR